jgi:hypothetical protein
VIAACRAVAIKHRGQPQACRLTVQPGVRVQRGGTIVCHYPTQDAAPTPLTRPRGTQHNAGKTTPRATIGQRCCRRPRGWTARHTALQRYRDEALGGYDGTDAELGASRTPGPSPHGAGGQPGMGRAARPGNLLTGCFQASATGLPTSLALVAGDGGLLCEDPMTSAAVPAPGTGSWIAPRRFPIGRYQHSITPRGGWLRPGRGRCPGSHGFSGGRAPQRDANCPDSNRRQCCGPRRSHRDPGCGREGGSPLRSPHIQQRWARSALRVHRMPGWHLAPNRSRAAGAGAARTGLQAREQDRG